jgi:hypothetical protein
MNCQFRCDTPVGWTALLLGMLLWTPVAAQEEAPEDPGGRYGSLLVSVQSWIAQPAGLGYSPASRAEFGSSSRTTLELSHGTEAEFRYDLEYVLPKKFGSLLYATYKHEDSASLALSDASFVFEQTLTHPLFAGVFLDSLSDQFASVAQTTLRDERLEYHRNAVSSPRVSVDWFVGWRRVEHRRNFAAEYFALSPSLPVVLPPACNECPDLDPFSEFASVSSDYDGRGLSVGVDLEFSLWRNKVVLEGGLGVAVLRGKTDAAYFGQNALYLLDCTGISPTLSTACFGIGDATIILEPPYAAFDEFFLDGNDPTFVSDNISQAVAPLSLQANSISGIGEVYDLNLGFRWRALRWLEAFAGFRQTHYSDVGIDLTPADVSLSQAQIIQGQKNLELRGLNVEAINQLDRSATYEGFYFGLTFRLY